MKKIHIFIKIFCFLFMFLLITSTYSRAQNHKKIFTGLFGIGEYGYDEAFKLLKENGFDIAVGVNEKHLLDKANALGIKCIVSFSLTRKIATDEKEWAKFLERLKSKVVEVKNHPAVFAWYIVDEPDGQRIPLGKLKEARALVKSLDKTKPMFVVLDSPPLWGDYIPYFDIIAIDPYLLKLKDGTTETPEKVREWIKELRFTLKANELDRPIWVVLGAFKIRPRNPFSFSPPYKRITPEEFSEMLKIAIDERVGGILVWTLSFKNYPKYRDWNLAENYPRLWKTAQNIPRIINKGEQEAK